MKGMVLDPWDIGVIATYMLGLIAMGAVLRKRATGNLEEYFLAGRKMPGWLNGVSYAATCLNADVAPAYCGMTVITGTFICWWYIGRFGLALMIGAVLFAALWRRLALATSPEFYEIRFSGGPAVVMRTWVALRSALIAVVAWTGAGLLGMHKVAEPLLGWDLLTTLLVVIPIILFYVLLSGYIGVVISDFFQSLIIIGVSLSLCWSVLSEFGGPAGLREALVANFGESVVAWHPPTQHELLGIVGVLAWTLGTAVGYGGDAAPMAGAMEGQRILSCRNAREASKMYVWTQGVLFLMLLALTLPALGAMVKWPGLRDGSINRELSYGMLLKQYCGPGFLGLAVSAMLAAIMSTVSSNMNFGAQVFVNDVYKRLIVKNGSEKHYLRIGRIMAALIVGLAVVVATTAQNVIDISVFMLGLSSAELTANWAQWWWWRFNGPARLAASFGGPLIYALNQFVVFKYWIEAGPYAVVFVSMGATCLLWITVALLTRPEPMDKLVEFYRRARPSGWWGPVAELVGDRPARGVIGRGFVVAVLGALMVASATIALSSAYVGGWTVFGIGTAASALTGWLFQRGFNRELS